jgi:hypothetical protein
VFFVHLRRPKSKPDERRDDPFYEEGSFGCTGCHSSTLFSPRHAADLEGARLAFIQGGPLGHRLVFLTPPVTVRVWSDRCEARWTPAEMPFKYSQAPILICNNGNTEFPLVKQSAQNSQSSTRDGRPRSLEERLSSRLRTPVHPLSAEIANEVIAVYTRRRAETMPSAISTSYEEALPWQPPIIDRDRAATYRNRISQLAGDSEGANGSLQPLAVPEEAKARSGCGSARRPQADHRTKTRRCT